MGPTKQSTQYSRRQRERQRLGIVGDPRPYHWRALLGPELTERLIAEAHADIPAVREEFRRLRNQKAKAAKAGNPIS